MTPEEKERAKVNTRRLGTPSIYSPGSPTVQAQDRMNAFAGGVADDVALTTGVRGLNTIGRAVTMPVVNAASRVYSDFADTNMNRERLLRSRESLSAPDASKFGGGMPRTTVAAAPGNPLSALSSPALAASHTAVKGSPRPEPIIGNPEQSIRNSQAWLRENKPGYATGGVRTGTATAPAGVPTSSAAAPQNGNFLYPEDQARMERVGGIRQMMQSPNPDIAYSRMRDPATGKNVVRETINGSGNNSAPALQTPFVSAKAFAQRTGWDKDGNPIYSTGADEMAAANAGIADYNTALMAGYRDRNIAFASEQGGIPKDQASAAYDNARALEEPLEGQSSRGLRAAQARQADAAAKGLPQSGGGIKPYYGTTERLVEGEGVVEEPYVIVPDNVGGFRMVRPQEGAAANLQAMAKEMLNPEQRSKAVKYAKEHPEEDKESILARVIAGEI